MDDWDPIVMKACRVLSIGLAMVLALISSARTAMLADAAAPCEPFVTEPAAIPRCATTTVPQLTDQDLIYHKIVVDGQGNILPWYNPHDLCDSYDHIIRLVFEWWLAMERNPEDPDIPYYLMHMTWEPPGESFDAKGLGGDQLAMAMSSWRLLYAYNGDQRAIADMVLMANHVLDNGLSPATDLWPNIPYPYNVTELDRLSGDMLYGERITQPDKAGSFGYELLNLYKITADNRYLQAAVKIADTLALFTEVGNEEISPLPFRVNTADGTHNDSLGNIYTTNFTGTLMLWEDLEKLGQGNLPAYQVAHARILDWLRTYPVHNNEWGPFFEDFAGYTTTQINAVTLAMYILDHREIWGETWQVDARFALDWPITALKNTNWIQYGVYVINEQTGYQQPGNSHTSRQASMELRYAELTGDTSRVTNAVRQLSWATYMVDYDGKNRYHSDDIWLTDGYGDYVRHYLRAMAAAPGLAPDHQDHLLRTSSVIRAIDYQAQRIDYVTFDRQAEELLKITTFIPLAVTADGVALPRLSSTAQLETQEGYTLNAPGDLPGVLRIRHDDATSIAITGLPPVLTFLPVLMQAH